MRRHASFSQTIRKCKYWHFCAYVKNSMVIGTNVNTKDLGQMLVNSLYNYRLLKQTNNIQNRIIIVFSTS